MSEGMSWFQFVLHFALNLSALTFGIRITSLVITGVHSVPIIVTIWIAVNVLWSVVLAHPTGVVASSLCSLFALMCVFDFLRRKRGSERTSIEAIRCLSLFSLGLRSGKSISAVADHVLKNHRADFSNEVLKLLEVVAFSQQEIAPASSLTLQKLQKTLLHAAKERHHACLFLENFREELFLLQTFRHRSGQATLQVRMQAYICAALYVFLLVLLTHWLGWSSVQPIFFPSLILMLLGLFTLSLLGRKRKWKT